ncbi:MAG: RodZ domain-containing protein [Gallionellaceae bacterium]
MEVNSTTALNVGQILREAREQQGLSVNDVANRIKFAPKQIEWLEADDFTKLPEAAFVRGFVRSYARLLNLDSAGLIANLPTTHLQATSRLEMKSVDIPLPGGLSAHRYNILWLAAALLVALSLAVFERMHNSVPEKIETVVNGTTVRELELPVGEAPKEADQLPAQTADATAAAEPQQADNSEKNREISASKILVPVAPMSVPKHVVEPVKSAPAQQIATKTPKQVEKQPEKTAAHAAVKQAEQPISEEVKQAEKTPEVQKTIEPPVENAAMRTEEASPSFLQRLFAKKPAPVVDAVPETQPAIKANVVKKMVIAEAAQAPVKTESAPVEHALRIEFDEDAWLEIKDGNDKTLISRMHTAGSLVRVTGKSPLLVVVGNFKAVRLFDNGKKIKLERYATGDVARVKLK